MKRIFISIIGMSYAVVGIFAQTVQDSISIEIQEHLHAFTGEGNLSFVSLSESEQNDRQTNLSSFIWQEENGNKDGLLSQKGQVDVVPVKVNQPKKSKKSIVMGDLHSHIANTISIDESAEVGEIAYESTATPSGGKSIRIPLTGAPVPVGTVPELSLSYNSQQSNGEAGYGWTVEGVSCIRSTNNSLYYDGNSRGPLENSLDNNYTLDGTRLIKTDYLHYVTERGNIKVKMNIIDGPGYSVVKNFSVLYPDGRKATYGVYTGNYERKQEFPLVSMEDLFGNQVRYIYTYVNNHYRLSSVSYGKALEAQISFSYKSRYDNYERYVAGKQVLCDYLLDRVEMKYNNNVQRTYVLEHDSNSFDRMSLLVAVHCLAGNKHLQPLRFHYGDGEQEDSFQSSSTQLMSFWNFGDNPDQVIATRGRFDYWSDGDGIIMYPNKVKYYEYYKEGNLFNRSYRWIGTNYTGEEDIVIAGALGDGFSINEIIKTGKGFVDIFSMDVDDVPGEEIVKVNNYHVSGNTERLEFHVYRTNMMGVKELYTRTFDLPTALIYTRHNESDYSIHPKFYYPGDFDGDGKTEILAISGHFAGGFDVTSEYYLFDLENNRIIRQGSAPFSYWVQLPIVGTNQLDALTAYNNSNKLYPCDFDGDGKADLAYIDDAGTHIYTFHGAGWTKKGTYAGLSNTMLPGKTLLQGEFNGDGKTDFILSPAEGGSNLWSIFSADGKGTFVKKELEITTNTSTSRFIVQDMNGDGYSDIVERYSGNSLIVHFVADNRHLSSVAGEVLEDNTLMIPTAIQSNYYFGQLAVINNEGVINKIGYNKNVRKERLLTSMASSLGVVHKFAYGLMNECDASLCTQGYGAAHPYQNFNGPLMLLAVDETYQLGVKTAWNRYLYYNAVAHKQGLGFCGFERLTQINQISNESVYQVFEPYNFGVLKSMESPRQSIENVYNIQVSDNKTARVDLRRQTITDKLKLVTTTTDIPAYDDYGNPLRVLTDYGEDMKTIQTNAYDYSVGDEVFCIQLLSQTVTDTCNHVAVAHKTVFGYDENGFPITQTKYRNGKQVAQETYVYNSDKLLKEVGTKQYEAPMQTTSFEYDSYGHRTKTTDPMGLSTTCGYSDVTGLLDFTVDPRSNQTSYFYDDFGRQIKEERPDGSVSQTVLGWTSEVQDAVYVATTTATGQPTEQTYYDALGRKLRTAQKRFDDTWLRTDYRYDSQGRLYQISLPHKGEADLWNTYQYDSYDRLLKIKYASGKSDQWSYDGNSISSTADGITVAKHYNARGELVSMNDPGGIVNYYLRPDGQPDSIVLADNIVTRFEYDEYGRQLKIDDPSAGVQTYTYDEAGNVASQTDANGETTTFLYDEFNRLEQKISREFSTGYTYDRYGMLRTEASSNWTSRTLTYDGFGRLETEMEIVSNDGKGMFKHYTYDEGNVSAIEYQTTQYGVVATEQYSYQNGHLTEIKLDETNSIWKLAGEDELGKPISVETGVVHHTYEHNAFGFPTERKAVAGSNVLFHQAYDFDVSTGNLNSRSDDVHEWIEEFSYDNLNRLTGIYTYKFGHLQESWRNIQYQPNGNIDSMDDIGLFAYNDMKKPYQLTHVYSLSDAAAAGATLRQNVTYTSFNRPATIVEGEYASEFTYNARGERVKMVETYITEGGSVEKYYVGGRHEFTTSDRAVLYLGGDAYSAPAVLRRNWFDGTWELYYIIRDYLGSICAIVDSDGALTAEYSYDPWGRLRNPETYEVDTSHNKKDDLFLERGFTGHEHLPVYGLINMNARLYDPGVGRFLSPDPYVQAPDFSQSFNRYSYALNNPLKYVDPNGELFLFWLFFTENGYNFQKQISPIAFTIKLNWNTEQKSIGYELSYGIPQGVGLSYRRHRGQAYYFQDYDNSYTGWEKSSGAEWGVNLPLLGGTFSCTFYDREGEKFDQYRDLVTVNVAGIKVQLENDANLHDIIKYPPWLPDHKMSDKHLTAQLKISIGGLEAGITMFTGEAYPGSDRENGGLDPNLGPYGTYKAKDGYDPDEYRAGIFYFKIGPFVFGRNSENIRDAVQNRLHDTEWLHTPRFKKLDRPGRWYWGIAW